MTLCKRLRYRFTIKFITRTLETRSLISKELTGSVISSAMTLGSLIPLRRLPRVLVKISYELSP